MKNLYDKILCFFGFHDAMVNQMPFRYYSGDYAETIRAEDYCYETIECVRCSTKIAHTKGVI